MAAIAWPAAALIFLVFVVLVFRTQLARFFDRAESIGGDRGIRAGPRQPELENQERSLPESTSLPALPPAPVSGSDAGPRLETDVMLAGTDLPTILERDRNVRASLERLATPSDKDKILIRSVAAMATDREFERAYRLIYGSQINALGRLNSAGEDGLSSDDVRPSYDEAARLYPDLYATYPFERWIDFLTRSGLVRDSANGYALTGWGYDFVVLLARSRYPLFKPY